MKLYTIQVKTAKFNTPESLSRHQQTLSPASASAGNEPPSRKGIIYLTTFAVRNSIFKCF